MNKLEFFALAADSGQWTFDLLSALIGAVLTAIIAVLMYVYRKVIGKIWRSAGAQTRQMIDKLTASVELHYYDGLPAYLDTFEVLPHIIPLKELFVAPRFITPLPRPSLIQDSAPLPPRVILGPVWQSSKYLLVTGRPGSGKTALLLHLARTFAQQNQQGTYDPSQKHIPIYVNLVELSTALPALDAATPEQSEPGGQIPPRSQKNAADDPAAILIANVTSHVSVLIGGNLGNQLRRWLTGEQALVLLDGLDALNPGEQARAMDWIGKLVERYPQPRYVVAAPTRGYGRLANLGFAAVPLAEWSSIETHELARRWTKVQQESDEHVKRLSDAIKPAPGTVLLPLDSTLTAVVWRKTGSVPATLSGIYGQFVDSLLEETANQLSPTTPRLSVLLNHAILGQVATLMLKEGRHKASRDEIERIIAELVPTDGGQASLPSQGATGPNLPKSTADSLEIFVKSGLLIEQGQAMYGFPHPRIELYLAAWNLAQRQEMATLLERVDDPMWSDVFEFCAGMLNISPLIDTYLKQPDDLLGTRLWTAVSWAAGAPLEAPWRGKVLGEVARLWMQPNPPPQVRERALSGLLSTRDKGLPYLFKKAMTHPDPKRRAQAVQGLGKLGREPDLEELKKALQDTEKQVCIAAAHAIESIPGDAAIEVLVDALLQADEPIQQAAAEALAMHSEKGKNILREAVKEEDLLVRRATAFGLRLVGETWALELLAQMEREDSQWMVRSAAIEALRLAHKSEAEVELDLTPLKLEEQGWLVEWGATRGIGVGLGRTALPVLIRALAEGDAQVKLAAIRAMARLGEAETIAPLRQALGEPDDTIQTEALRALTEISARTGQKITS